MSEDIALKELVQSLAEERGLDLRGYKPTTLGRRVQKRMHQVGVKTYPEYLQFVRNEPHEINELLDVVLINVTEFFRDPQAWEALQHDVLPRLLGGVKAGDSFRAWSAGCATGEEPYSLAILVADLLGPKLAEIDAKIYATDIDEQALHVARRGEYAADHLRLVRPDLRERYFTGTSHLRINRELRRLVIFGRSNLMSDAPISHCQLILCRNVLIYFDTATQKQILSRLHYALEPGAAMMLGKAESKLTDSQLFHPINARWRIFQKIGRDARPSRGEEGAASAPAPDYDHRLELELQALRLQHEYLLQTMRSGVTEMDVNDVVTACNEAALGIWGLQGARLVGKRIQNTELVFRCPELPARIEIARSTREAVRLQCTIRQPDGDERVVSLALRSVFANSGERTGMLLNCEDVTSQDRLQSTVEQLEATGEELQSANEELETTNEELQSTNEELETTNEELQSTNEELETTNEELQSLNEELENMNQELEARSHDLNALSSRYEETLKRMPWPVILVDRDLRIQLWNGAAQRLFGVPATSVSGVELEKLPADGTLIRNLVRRCRNVLEHGKVVTLREQLLRNASSTTSFDVQFTPASRNEDEVEGVLIIVGPFHAGEGNGGNSRPEALVVRGEGAEGRRKPASNRSAKRK